MATIHLALRRRAAGTDAPWLVFAPGTTLAMAILAINLLGDGLREAIDPLPSRSLK